MISSFFAVAHINYTEEWLRQAESSEEFDERIRVANDTTGLQLGPEALTIELD
jgi:hypothetical protein